jgi:hypothetical protein
MWIYLSCPLRNAKESADAAERVGHTPSKRNEKSKPRKERYVNKIKKNGMQKQQNHINAEQRGNSTSQSIVNHAIISSDTMNTKNWAGIHV